jgi:hypothetical protein
VRPCNCHESSETNLQHRNKSSLFLFTVHIPSSSLPLFLHYLFLFNYYFFPSCLSLSFVCFPSLSYVYFLERFFLFSFLTLCYHFPFFITWYFCFLICLFSPFSMHSFHFVFLSRFLCFLNLFIFPFLYALLSFRISLSFPLFPLAHVL